MEITRIRLLPEAGEKALEAFVFGGHYGPIRPPRGVAPPQVAAFVTRRVVAEGDADDVGKARELVRFYESASTVAPLMKRLVPPAGSEDFALQCRVCHIVGDLGTPDEVAKAVQHIEQRLVPSPLALDAVPELLAALLALSPTGNLGGLRQRLVAEQARLAPAQNRSERDMVAYDRVTSLIRNGLDRTQRLVEVKRRLAETPIDEGRSRFVRIYLGMEPPLDASLQTWLARRLRREGIDAAPEAVQTEFRAILDTFTAVSLKDQPVMQARFWRAERAYRYFGGAVTEAHLALRAHAVAKGLDFLDDDD